jgi:hypothetical protein
MYFHAPTLKVRGAGVKVSEEGKRLWRRASPMTSDTFGLDLLFKSLEFRVCPFGESLHCVSNSKQALLDARNAALDIRIK